MTLRCIICKIFFEAEFDIVNGGAAGEKQILEGLPNQMDPCI